jgi:hypothetical protein
MNRMWCYLALSAFLVILAGPQQGWSYFCSPGQGSCGCQGTDDCNELRHSGMCTGNLHCSGRQHALVMPRAMLAREAAELRHQEKAKIPLLLRFHQRRRNDSRGGETTVVAGTSRLDRRRATAELIK